MIYPNYPPVYPTPQPWVVPVYSAPQPKPVHIHHYHPAPVPKNRAQEFSAVEAGTKTAHVIFILDDSGSMQSCRNQTISGYNEYLQGQMESEVPTFVSLYKFDGCSVNSLYSRVPVSTAPKLNLETYNPQGGTNLLDAIGSVILETNQKLSAIGNVANRDSVTLVILTDGEENSSREFTNENIKMMVEKAETKNWSFFFFGANIDAFSVGSSLGFWHSNTVFYSTANMGATMAMASRATNDMKSVRSAGMATMDAYMSTGFTEEERNEAAK